MDHRHGADVSEFAGEVRAIRLRWPQQTHLTRHPASGGGSPLASAAGSVLVQATTAEDWDHARALIREHLDWIAGSFGREIGTIQPSVLAELADLPGHYTPPHGARFLAMLDGRPAGTCGYTDEGGGLAELRRLYVRPAARGHRMGERLVATVLADAAARGFHTIRLGTVEGMMDAAITIYRRAGFRDTPPFGDFHEPGMLFLARPLSGLRSVP